MEKTDKSGALLFKCLWFVSPGGLGSWRFSWWFASSASATSPPWGWGSGEHVNLVSALKPCATQASTVPINFPPEVWSTMGGLGTLRDHPVDLRADSLGAFPENKSAKNQKKNISWGTVYFFWRTASYTLFWLEVVFQGVFFEAARLWLKYANWYR